MCLFLNIDKMKILFPVFLCLAFLSLSSGKKPEKNFCVTVTADSSLCAPSQYVYLYYFCHNECYIEDSALLSAQDKTVQLYGFIPEQESVSLLFEKQGPGKVDLIATPGDRIHIHINDTDLQNVVMKRVMGSPATNEEADYFNRRNSLLQLRFSLLEKAIIYQSDSSYQALNDEIKEIEEELKRNVIHSLKNTAHPYIAWERAVLLSVNDYGEDSVKRMRTEVMSRFPNYEKMWRLKPDRGKCPPGSDKSRQNQARIRQIKEQKRLLKNGKEESVRISEEPQNGIKVTGRYALWNIEASDTNNVTRMLPVSTDRYVFVNFWATWCVSCLLNMNFIEQLPAKYGERLLIYNISLDNNKKKWKNFIQSSNPEIYNLSGISNQGELYKSIERLNIEMVPANYLIGPDGKILFMDISKRKLVHALDSIFNL